MTFFHEIKLVHGGSYHIPLEMWNSLSRENQEFLEKDDYENPTVQHVVGLGKKWAVKNLLGGSTK